MEIDKWVGPYKVRAFPWPEGNLIYFNVQCYAPGQSLEKPPALDRTVYINDDSAGRRLVFEFTHTLAAYVAELHLHMNLDQSKSPGSKIVITAESEPPTILARHTKHDEQPPQSSKRHSKKERGESR